MRVASNGPATVASTQLRDAMISAHGQASSSDWSSTMSAADRIDSATNAKPSATSSTPIWAASRSSSTEFANSSPLRVGRPNASDSRPASRASNISAEVESSMRMKESVRMRITRRDEDDGLVRYRIITTRPEMTIEISQATTAAQMITSAREPMTGTSCSFAVSPLRTTSRGTTPMATTPRARTRIGRVNPAMSPASRSGSVRRIAAISALITDRARRNDILRATTRI